MVDYRDRSRPYRVVRREEQAPPPPEDHSVPNLKRGPVAELLAGLPQWQRSILTIIMASGLSLGGVVKFVGVETTKAATERETRLTARVVALETRLTELRQGIRKDGLSKQAQADVARALEIALAARHQPKAKKPKPKPTADAPPAEPEGDPP